MYPDIDRRIMGLEHRVQLPGQTKDEALTVRKSSMAVFYDDSGRRRPSSMGPALGRQAAVAAAVRRDDDR
jgi:hypothetical protein